MPAQAVSLTNASVSSPVCWEAQCVCTWGLCEVYAKEVDIILCVCWPGCQLVLADVSRTWSRALPGVGIWSARPSDKSDYSRIMWTQYWLLLSSLKQVGIQATLLGWSSILRGIITHRVEGRYLCAKKWGAPAGSGRGSTHVSLWVKLGGLQARPSEFHDEMLFLDRWWHGFRSGSQCAAVMVGKWSESRLVGSLILTLG